MLQTAMPLILLVSCSLGLDDNKSQSRVWQVDKETVLVGGCLAITLDLPSRELSKVMLRIDTHQPIRLVDVAGPAVRLQEQTVVLLSHDLFSPVMSQASDGTMTTVQIPPIFSQPGTVQLALEENGVSWGTKSLIVVAAPQEAEPAIELLYPTAVRGDQLLVQAGRLMHLITIGSFGEGGGIDQQEELNKVREVLPELMKHADWAEIFENLVGWQEIIQYRQSIITSDDGHPGLKDDISELPPMPESARRCLSKELKNPFARKYQDNIRDSVTDIDRLIEERRSVERK